MRLAVIQLGRAPVRSVLTVLAVAALVFVVEFLATLSRTLQAFSTGALAHDRADVLVYASSARGSLDASRLPAGLAARADHVRGVAGVAELGVFDFTVTGHAGSFQLALFGVGPGRAGLPAAPVRGRLPGSGQVLADTSEAGDGLGIGREVTLRPGAIRLRVTGTASGIRYDGVVTAWTAFSTWQGAVAAASPGGAAAPANALAVRARPGVSPEVMASRLDAALPGTRAFTRSAAVADAPGAAIIAGTFDLLIGIAFGVAVLVVGSVFLLVTIQRLRSWVLLRALGASAGRLGLAVLCQVTVVVLAAAAVATAVLAVATAASSATFPVRVAPDLVAAAVAAMLLGGAVSALLPVRRIARLDPATALARH